MKYLLTECICEIYSHLKYQKALVLLDRMNLFFFSILKITFN